MEITKNIYSLLRDGLKQIIDHGSKMEATAPCFSIYGFEAVIADVQRADCPYLTFQTIKNGGGFQVSETNPTFHNYFEVIINGGERYGLLN
jgi:hypothetical protein